jgi:5'-3' exonuclease
MIIHLIDGTYELYRHFYGQRSFNKGNDKPFGVVVGVLHGVLQMIEEGATHIGVATDHVIESFRNQLWADYKTGAGVVQIDRKANAIRDANAVRKKFGVSPTLIPDFLALVGDSADGYPGISGIGKIGAVQLLNQYGPIEAFPEKVLGGKREQALLFKNLATLRTGTQLFSNIDQLRWQVPTSTFGELTTKLGDPRLLERAKTAAAKVTSLPD